MMPTPPPVKSRTRYLQWGALIALVLLAPAILIPLFLSLTQQPAFQTLDEIDLTQVRAMEIFVLNRPDNGPDVGSTRGMFVVPPGDYRRMLDTLQPALLQPEDTGRGIWLGRMVVTMNDRRRQTVLFHRSKNEANVGTQNPVQLRIGRKLFLGPPVNDFTAKLHDIAGLAKDDDLTKRR
jgi:hypothetical protein